MRALIQRVNEASVTINGKIVGEIQQGILVFLGVQKEDCESNVDKILHKIIHYRIFSDNDGKMNLNVQEVAGGLLVVSQFTLAAQTHKGLRPGFSTAASPEHAEKLYEYFLQQARSLKSSIKTSSGRFGADMQVSLINDGPVTFLLEN